MFSRKMLTAFCFVLLILCADSQPHTRVKQTLMLGEESLVGYSSSNEGEVLVVAT